MKKLIILITLMTAFLSGCGLQNNEFEYIARLTQPVEVVVAYDQSLDYNDYLVTQTESFNEQNEMVTITLTDIPSFEDMATTTTTPTMALVDAGLVTDLYEGNKIIDLAPYFELPTLNFKSDTFIYSTFDKYYQENFYPSIPYHKTTDVVYVNEDLIDYPDELTGSARFLSFINEQSQIPSLVIEDKNHFMYEVIADCGYVSWFDVHDDVAFNDTCVQTNLQAYGEELKSGNIIDDVDAFIDQEVPVMIGQSSNISAIKATGMNLGVYPLPFKMSDLSGEDFVISTTATSDQALASLMYINFLTEDVKSIENFINNGYLPIRTSTLEELSKNNTELMDTLTAQFGNIKNLVPHFSGSHDVSTELFDQFIESITTDPEGTKSELYYLEKQINQMVK